MNLVSLTFRDITATCDWTSHEEVECIEVEVIGWMVHKDHETVKLATARVDGEYSAVHAIPTGCITEITTLVFSQEGKPDGLSLIEGSASE